MIFCLIITFHILTLCCNSEIAREIEGQFAFHKKEKKRTVFKIEKVREQILLLHCLLKYKDVKWERMLCLSVNRQLLCFLHLPPCEGRGCNAEFLPAALLVTSVLSQLGGDIIINFLIFNINFLKSSTNAFKNRGRKAPFNFH